MIPIGLIPAPEVASAAVAENEDGSLAGVLFVQLALHMEPLVLTSPQVSFLSLYNVLYNALQKDKGVKFYCFTDNDTVRRMAEHVGMIEVAQSVFEQEVV